MRANVLINVSLAAASTLLIQMTGTSWLWLSLYLSVVIEEEKKKGRKNRLVRVKLLYCLAAT
ncbi:hypothetical protein PMIT1323_00497 [Prochlorococcus marinus str. MIT 1323]|nr:hypothetical protein PMIT1323_00497 [Prochlorococcus marinus str. MIT 1323]